MTMLLPYINVLLVFAMCVALLVTYTKTRDATLLTLLNIAIGGLLGAIAPQIRPTTTATTEKGDVNVSPKV